MRVVSRAGWSAARACALLAACLSMVALAPVPSAGAVAGSVDGAVELVSGSGDGVRVAGRAVAVSGGPVRIVLQTDVGWFGPFAADAGRFDIQQPLPGGWRSVCVRAFDPADSETLLGCNTILLDEPYGAMDDIRKVGGQLNVTGWGADEDSAGGPLTVAVQSGGLWYGPFQTGQSRPDVSAVYPWAGPTAGFAVSIPLPPAGSTVPICTYVAGVGAGSPSSNLGCRTYVGTDAPIGDLEVLGASETDVRVAGWMADPNTDAPIRFTVRSGATVFGPFEASAPRPDVAATFVGTGQRHGFDIRIPALGGAATYCVFAANVDAGPPETLLGCRQVMTIPAGSGTGRRIVYHNLGQRVWAVGADGYTVQTYPISGRYLDPRPGTVHRVYGKLRYATAGHDGITMEYFVAFNPAGLGYGFHTIPKDRFGQPLQSEAQLGTFRSAGCVRQAARDAIFLWNWSVNGDLVYVV